MRKEQGNGIRRKKGIGNDKGTQEVREGTRNEEKKSGIPIIIIIIICGEYVLEYMAALD